MRRNTRFAGPLIAMACGMIALPPVPIVHHPNDIIVRMCGSNASVRLPLRGKDGPTPDQDHRSLACHIWLRKIGAEEAYE